MSDLRRFLPPWPVVPPLLWVTLGTCVMAGLNLGCYDEIWLNQDNKVVSVAAMLLLLLVIGSQLTMLFWCWPLSKGAPWWWQAVFWVGSRCLGLGLGILTLLLGLALLFWTIMALTEFPAQD